MKKLLPLICLLFFSGVGALGQNVPAQYNKIELNDGEIIQEELYNLGRKYSGTDKIKVCKENTKDCKKIPISEINKISILTDDGDIFRTYKVLYSPEKRLPRLCISVYEGINFDFYYFETTSLSNKSGQAQIFITKANSTTIEHNYARTANIKTNLKHLTEIFKECSAFRQESEQKKAYKKHDITYFYKLADNCEI